jgi:hypothetical protein
MSWRLLFSLAFALAYLVWIWRGYKAYNRIGRLLCLVGSLGIAIDLTCDYIRTLPSHAPLGTLTGLATNKSSLFFDHSNSDFVLIEAGTDRHILCSTGIEGPWADEPVRATYVDDGRFIHRVVGIEILSDDQFPWHVVKGHAGWVGSSEARRTAPPFVYLLVFAFVVAGVFALPTRSSRPLEGVNAKVSGG